MDRSVIIGKVVGVFGLKGILKVWPDTDFPQRFDEGRTVFINDKSYKILETRWHKQQVRIRVEGITKIDQGEALIGNPVAVSADDIPELQEGEYMIDDLLGLNVFDESGKELGTLDDVHRGAQDLYQVGSTLIPAVKEFILEVDIAGKRMIVRPIQGMFDDAD